MYPAIVVETSPQHKIKNQLILLIKLDVYVTRKNVAEV